MKKDDSFPDGGAGRLLFGLQRVDVPECMPPPVGCRLRLSLEWAGPAEGGWRLHELRAVAGCLPGEIRRQRLF